MTDNEQMMLDYIQTVCKNKCKNEFVFCTTNYDDFPELKYEEVNAILLSLQKCGCIKILRDLSSDPDGIAGWVYLL